jgi:3',5'-nucleoside bisphosphate phosphatase
LTISTRDLVLPADAAIDLQLHTVYSDGTWTPDALIAHARAEAFGVIAVTDHDSPQTAGDIQRLAREHGQPVLVATELTTTWNGEYTDILCYGFNPAASEIREVAAVTQRRQRENTARACATLRAAGIDLPADDVDGLLALSSAKQATAIVATLQRLGNRDAGTLARDAGVRFEAIDAAFAVEACHAAGGVCVVAHPGRGTFFTQYYAALLDELRRDVPIDGIEAHYPRHSAEQTGMFVEYAARHGLVVSAGSDSHGPDRLPVKYPARLARGLLERVGIIVQ